MSGVNGTTGHPAVDDAPAWEPGLGLGNDPLELRLQVLRDNFTPVIDEALGLLAQVTFGSDVLREAHGEQLKRRELLYRHSMPYLLPLQFGRGPTSISDDDVGCLATVFLAHTLALTHMDYHLDGVFPDASADASAAVLPHDVAVGYTSRALLESLSRSDEWCGESGPHIRGLITEISGFVLERMVQDSLERHQPPDPSQTAAQYLSEPRSRLMASGYWEVMFRAGAHRLGQVPTTSDLTAIRKLRRLRQIIDEIADLEEDIAAGHYTLPLRLACAGSDGERFRQVLSGEWEERKRSRFSATSPTTQALAAQVRNCGAYDAAVGFAIGIANDIRQYCWSAPDDALRRTVEVLADIRMAWLNRFEPSSALRPFEGFRPWIAEVRERPLRPWHRSSRPLGG